MEGNVLEGKKSCYACGSETSYQRKDRPNPTWYYNYDINGKPIHCLCKGCHSHFFNIGPLKNLVAHERYQKNKDKILAHERERYHNNRAILRKRQNELQKTDNYKLKRRLYMSRWSKENRIKLIDLLGGKCARCGNTDFRVVQLDHKKGQGIADLKRFGRPISMYRYYLKNPTKAKEELQPLCANCNIIKKYENAEIRHYLDDF